MPYVSLRAGVLGAALAVGAVASSIACVAEAAEDHSVTGAITLSSTSTAPLIYRNFTVTSGGMVNVAPYDGTAGTGQLFIVADKIDIQSGGSIIADAAGYVGAAGAQGACSMLATACAQAGQMLGMPGGGGGFFGNGANGATEMDGGCVDLGAMAAGGLGFFSKTTLKVDLGSAGGASNLSPSTGTNGYSGGGIISLSAAVITIDGVVSSNGDGNASHIGGVGPVVGSGGVVEILAAKLSGAGMISVNGGQGARGAGVPPSIPANSGGGGSGGVLILHLPSTVTTTPVQTAISGGATGDCTGLAGAQGTVVFDPIVGDCVDLDHDGYTSTLCGGTDCDDTNKDIHPGEKQICNGIDNNCSGMIDVGPDICPANESCVAFDGGAHCVGIDAGTNPGATLEDIDFGGGCELPTRAGAGGSGADLDRAVGRGAGALALALALVAVRARRRRASR
jgi:hypothetical protein